MSWDYKRVTIDGETKLKHRHVMEQKLGRELKENEHIHHKNEDPTDNRVDNLEVINPSEHTRIHKKGDGVCWIELECDKCGKEFERRYRQRAENKGYENSYCSKSCAAESNSGGARNVNEEVDNDIIKEEMAKDMSSYKIAEKHGWPRSTVYRRMKNIEDNK